MTVDREQIRRDAEAMVAIHGDNAKLAHACLRVLAELEQAEWERDGERTRVNFLTSALAEAEAQLAKVPALVEALRESNKILGAMCRDGSFFATLASDALRKRIRSAHEASREALAAWESLDAEGAPLQVPPESRRLDRAMLNRDEHTR